MSARPPALPVSATVNTNVDNLVEVAASKLEVDETEHVIQPIKWLNKAHHGELLSSHLLTTDLARRIDAYAAVNSTDVKD